MSKLPVPPKDAILFETKDLYVCLASFPLSKGHTVIVWKKEVADLRKLTCKQYEHLMHTVDLVRDALLKVLKVKKVYLVYMDEIKHVHWHLVPRYNRKGFDIFEHTPQKTKDFSLAPKLREAITKIYTKHRKDF